MKIRCWCFFGCQISGRTVLRGDIGFLNTMEEVHLLVSPNPTVRNEVYFHDITAESADMPTGCCLAEPGMGGRVTRFITTDSIAIICLTICCRCCVCPSECMRKRMTSFNSPREGCAPISIHLGSGAGALG